MESFPSTKVCVEHNKLKQLEKGRIPKLKLKCQWIAHFFQRIFNL